jgi:superfamily II DNA or RNA helicase
MLTAYQAKYYAHELSRRCASDDLQKLMACLADAQVDLTPHQVDAALFAFHSPLSKGAILADEVGLGKTIEAGILLAQKWAEQKRKLLVIVPASLRQQWLQELAEKFFLPGQVFDTRHLKHQNGDGQNLDPFRLNNGSARIVICSYQFARSQEATIAKVPWDLVVIDEAHRLRNVHQSANVIAQAIKNAVAHAPKVLLTATPMQNNLLELFGLVSVIDAGIFGSKTSFLKKFSGDLEEKHFKELKQRLKPVCWRTLRKDVREFVCFTERHAIVQEFSPTPEEQKLYDLVSDYLQSPEIYALPSGQRGLMTLVLRKLLASSSYAISDTLGKLAGRLEAELNQAEAAPGFDEIVADEFAAFNETKEEWTDDSQPISDGLKAVSTDTRRQKIAAEVGLLKQCQELANSIKQNSKGTVLLRALRQGHDLTAERAALKNTVASKKAVIFTESTRTQKYVQEILEDSEYAGSSILFNGTNADPQSKAIYEAWLKRHANTERVTGIKNADMRAALVEKFRDDEKILILIATDAAAEGINLQFCSVVINFDLPWNPQRIEQRIGRCHRYGQKCDVVVVNFLNKDNAADQQVYQFLAEKCHLFNGVFGSSNEVLGCIESGVDIEKRIAEIYSRRREPEDIKRHFEALQRNVDSGCEERMMATRDKLLSNFNPEVLARLKQNKQQSEIFLEKYHAWLWQITKIALKNQAAFVESEAGTGTKSFSLLKDSFGGETFLPGPYRIGRNIDAENLYRLGHPLAQRIIAECLNLETPDRGVIIDFTSSRKTIRWIKSLNPKAGWLRLTLLKITALAEEERLIWTGVTLDGTALAESQCQELFNLPICEITPLGSEYRAEASPLLENVLAERQQEVVAGLTDRNSSFLEQEDAKLSGWFDDQIIQLSKPLEEVKSELTATTAAKFRETDMVKKFQLVKTVEKLETKVSRANDTFSAKSDELKQQNAAQLAAIKARSVPKLEPKHLFTLHWEIV